MPHRKKVLPGERPEFEVAWYTKELGLPLQRELLRRQLATLHEDAQAARLHGEDAAPDPTDTAPPDERAG